MGFKSGIGVVNVRKEHTISDLSSRMPNKRTRAIDVDSRVRVGGKDVEKVGSNKQNKPQSSSSKPSKQKKIPARSQSYEGKKKQKKDDKPNMTAKKLKVTGTGEKSVGKKKSAIEKAGHRSTPESSSSSSSSSMLSIGSGESEFFSCLTTESSWNYPDQSSPDSTDGNNLRIDSNLMLKRCLSIREVEDESWLSSSLIDLVISTFAKRYEDVFFLPIDFVIMALTSSDKELKNVTDIAGQKVDFTTRKPIVFVSPLPSILTFIPFDS